MKKGVRSQGYNMICTLLSMYALFFSYFGVVHGAERFESCSEYDTISCSAATATMPSNAEQTLVIIKPDGVQRGLVGIIISRFEQKGFKLVAMKMMQASTSLLSAHYADLSERPFYPGLIKYMCSGPVVPMVWQGPPGIIKTVRTMMGTTDPAAAGPGTIRGDYSVTMGRNLVHGSDSVESAEKEVNMWFPDSERVQWKQAAEEWINSGN